MMKFLSLKELHRLPPLPQDQTSARLRYLTAATTAAQRLRALGPLGHPSSEAARSSNPSGTVTRALAVGCQMSGIVRRFATEQFLESFSLLKESSHEDRLASRRTWF